MNLPYTRMAEQYQKHPEELPFEAYVKWHLEHGFLFSTPTFFIQGFAVDRDKLAAGLYPVQCWNPKGDCWYVADMAGDLTAAWSILPWELPWLGWHRDRDGGKDLHLVPLSRMRSLTKGTT